MPRIHLILRWLIYNYLLPKQHNHKIIRKFELEHTCNQPPTHKTVAGMSTLYVEKQEETYLNGTNQKFRQPRNKDSQNSKPANWSPDPQYRLIMVRNTIISSRFLQRERV